MSFLLLLGYYFDHVHGTVIKEFYANVINMARIFDHPHNMLECVSIMNIIVQMMD